MNNFQKITELELSGKKVIVRADLDVGEDFGESDVEKLDTILPTIKYLLEKNSAIILIGHRGRPNGVVNQNLSLVKVAEKLQQILGHEVKFVYDIVGQEAKDETNNLKPGEILMLENLRFDTREESNDAAFAEALSGFGEVYINEAFSSSHRDHASIVGIPKLLPHASGQHFADEIENLDKVLNNSKKPVVVVISGVKEDKLSYVESFAKFADKILIAGRLPDLLDLKTVVLSPEIPREKLVIAQLLPDKEDITIRSIEKFEEEIKIAGTIVVSGPMGKFEDPAHLMGTKRIFEAITYNETAFKVGGGGDTEQAIKLLGLKDKFNWVSVGGGASLEYLAKGTLPGIEVLSVNQEN